MRLKKRGQLPQLPESAGSLHPCYRYGHPSRVRAGVARVLFSSTVFDYRAHCLSSNPNSMELMATAAITMGSEPNPESDSPELGRA